MNNILRLQDSFEGSKSINKANNSLWNTRNKFASRINEVIEYDENELKIIDWLTQEVNRIKNDISSWINISDSMEYAWFLVKYSQLSPRVKSHFEKIFYDFRKVYLKEKVVKDLKYPSDDMVWLKSHIAELIDDHSDIELSTFYWVTVDAEDRIKYVLTKI